MSDSYNERESNSPAGMEERPEAFARARSPRAPGDEQTGNGHPKTEKPASAEDKDKGNENEQAEREKKQDEDAQKSKKPFWKRPILLTVMIAVAVLLIVGGVIWWLISRNYEHTDDAFIDGHIIHVAPRVAGRVSSLNVDDNQYVEAGTIVIGIDKSPFEAAYDNARASLAQARAMVEEQKANKAVQEANAAQARAEVIVAKANAANAEADYQRYAAVRPEARTQQQLDTSAANRQSTAAQVTSAEKKVASAEAQVVAAQTQIEAATAQVAAADAQLDQALLNLKYCDVTAGQSGYVTRRTVEQGNYVQIGQELLTIVPKAVWVTANFKETQLRYMQPNQPVEIKIDAFPEHKYRGHLDSVQTGTGAVFTVIPPENATGNFVKIVQRVPVKIVFDEPLDHVLAPGMSVEPKIDIRSGRRD